jgi:hypothetical protein
LKVMVLNSCFVNQIHSPGIAMVTWRVSLVEQQQFIFFEYMISQPVVGRGRVIQT